MLVFFETMEMRGNADDPTSNRWCLCAILHSGPTHESFKQGHEKHLPDVLHAFFPQQFSKMELESHKFCDLKMMI